MKTPFADRVRSGVGTLIALAFGGMLVSMWWVWPAVKSLAGPAKLGCSFGPEGTPSASSLCATGENIFWLMHHLVPLLGVMMLWITISGLLQRNMRYQAH